MHPKRLFALSLIVWSFAFLSSTYGTQVPERTVFVVWDHFVHLSNSGADHATNVQTYFKNCIASQVNPEEFYSVNAIKELTLAEDEFRQSADALHELRMRLEHPVPKGTMTAKR